LIENIAPRAQQVIRQPFKQKFAFNFPIVSRWTVAWHKANMLNAMSPLSRFHALKKSGERIILNALL